MQILVVEDNPTNRKIVEIALRRRGHTVVAVEDGRRGVAAFQSESFDVVLMDIQLPVMNGLEAISLMRQHERGGSRRSSRIIAITAHAMPEHRKICLHSGADDYLSKPFHIHQLLRVLKGDSEG